MRGKFLHRRYPRGLGSSIVEIKNKKNEIAEEKCVKSHLLGLVEVLLEGGRMLIDVMTKFKAVDLGNHFEVLVSHTVYIVFHLSKNYIVVSR